METCACLSVRRVTHGGGVGTCLPDAGKSTEHKAKTCSANHQRVLTRWQPCQVVARGCGHDGARLSKWNSWACCDSSTLSPDIRVNLSAPMDMCPLTIADARGTLYGNHISPHHHISQRHRIASVLLMLVVDWQGGSGAFSLQVCHQGGCVVSIRLKEQLNGGTCSSMQSCDADPCATVSPVGMFKLCSGYVSRPAIVM